MSTDNVDIYGQQIDIRLRYSCHGHKDIPKSKSSLVLLLPLFFGAIGGNALLFFVLHKFKGIINNVVRHYSICIASVDILRIIMVILPAICRLVGADVDTVFKSSFCFAGYWINLFGTQSSMLILTLAAYDRIMVLRKNDKYSQDKPRWKNTFIFGVVIPISYMSFDILYTKLFVATKTGSLHELMCYDSNLGWCTTKSAPHEHELNYQSELSGSKKAGVFICQAHIMTVLIVLSLLSLQSGHTNYKKMYMDNTREGSYYLLILAINVWLYLPTLFTILMDTFTASVFPRAYYEKFYVYLYILQLMPCFLNALALLVAYRELILGGTSKAYKLISKTTDCNTEPAVPTPPCRRITTTDSVGFTSQRASTISNPSIAKSQRLSSISNPGLDKSRRASTISNPGFDDRNTGATSSNVNLNRYKPTDTKTYFDRTPTSDITLELIQQIVEETLNESETESLDSSIANANV